MEPGTYIDTEVGVVRLVPVLPVDLPGHAGGRDEERDPDLPEQGRDSVPSGEQG